MNAPPFSQTGQNGPNQTWLNGLVFVYELSCCGFVSRCSHLYESYLGIIFGGTVLTFVIKWI